MAGSDARRIVLLGKTGAGKSSLANTIFEEELFAPNHSLNSGTKECKAITRSVGGRTITLIDTPGFFDTDMPEEDLKSAILRCITESAPGPHAFLIVLKAEKFTEHEKAVFTKVIQYFSEDALKYTAVVFTRGDQVPEGMKIEDYIAHCPGLNDLKKKCGGRCHVFDNKYWNSNQQGNYRSNSFQVEELLRGIEKIVMENKGSCYTNAMLQRVEQQIKREEDHLRNLQGDISEEEIREKAKVTVFERLWDSLKDNSTNVLLSGFVGVVALVGTILLKR